MSQLVCLVGIERERRRGHASREEGGCEGEEGGKEARREEGRKALTVKNNASLARHSSLPHAPRVVRLGVELLVGLHNSLPAAAKFASVLLEHVVARGGNGAKLVHIAASLADRLDKFLRACATCEHAPHPEVVGTGLTQGGEGGGGDRGRNKPRGVVEVDEKPHRHVDPLGATRVDGVLLRVDRLRGLVGPADNRQFLLGCKVGTGGALGCGFRRGGGEHLSTVAPDSGREPASTLRGSSSSATVSSATGRLDAVINATAKRAPRARSMDFFPAILW